MLFPAVYQWWRWFLFLTKKGLLSHLHEIRGLSEALKLYLKLSGLLGDAHKSDGLANSTQGRRRQSLKKLLSQQSELINIQSVAVINWREEQKPVSHLQVSSARDFVSKIYISCVRSVTCAVHTKESITAGTVMLIFITLWNYFIYEEVTHRVYSWTLFSVVFLFLPLIFKGPIYSNMHSNVCSLTVKDDKL